MSNSIFRKEKKENITKYYFLEIPFVTVKKQHFNKKIYFLGIQIFKKYMQKEHLSLLEHSIYKNRSQLHYLTRFIPQNFLNLVLINIVEHCNLNCVNCCHFSSLAENEFMDVVTYENDIKRLLELTDNKPYLIKNIQLCGGEPLLHPQLLDFFVVSRKYFPDNDLTVVTNGILLNQQKEEFWEKCNEYNVKIAPTVYPIKINWDSIEQKAKKYNVKLDYGYVLSQTMEIRPNQLKSSWHWPMDLEGNKDPLVSFANCNVGNNCVTLHHGKIYTCSLPTGIKHFNKYFGKNLQVTEADGINIYEAKNLTEVLNFIAKPIPFCRYCNVQQRSYNHPWDHHHIYKHSLENESDNTKCQNKISIKEWTL